MDIAINLNVHADTTPVVSSTMKVQTYTKHILRVGFMATTPEYEFGKEAILFTNTSLKGIFERVESGEIVDGIFISPEHLNTDISEIRTLAKANAIPFVLYTSKFDEVYKDIALRSGVDEYFYGNITQAWIKRLEFINKLKGYKNRRGNKPYEMQRVGDVPKIKLWTLKRTFDIAVSATGLLLLSPLMILIAILIKFDSRGPIFYIAKRAGSGYRIFDFYKFRSMRTGADIELQKLAHMNQYSESPEKNVFFKIKNDPRVTRLGQFLRDTSLDELPQLINVLKGDMSLVGNRPLPLYEAEKLTKDQIAWRFLAPAGITGLWQITKRGKENMSEEERIQLDMEYAMKNSFFYDMKILINTFPAVLQKVQA